MKPWEQEYEDNYSDDSNENEPYEDCPKCGRSYDDADFDFQICHFCKWDSEREKYLK